MKFTRTLVALTATAALGLVSPAAGTLASGHHDTHGHHHGHHGHAKAGLRVGGDVGHRLRLSNAQVAALPQHTLTTTYSSGGTPTTATFTGALLLDVANAAAPRFDPAVKNDALGFAIRGTGADGYRAVVAWGEIDPGFEGKQVLVALTENGVALAKPRLVVPGDAKGGRYVSDLVDLRVVDLG
ncbi:MAG: hypothetical protein JWO46_1999 [Nocardioidaceae bacterium]|nr:hypothetical protein [Nocardioidaceae bacterium]